MFVSRSLFACVGVALACLCFSYAAIADEPQYITAPDQFIVTFRDDMTRQEVLNLTRNLTATHRMRLRHTFRDTIKGFSAVVPPQALAALRNHPDVTMVESNGYWYIEGDDPRISTVDAPTNLSALPLGLTQIDLTWTDNATTEAGFEIARSTTGIGGSYSRLSVIRSANATSYTDTQVVIGQEYCYQVRAGQSAAVIGPYSAASCATIVDTPPSNPPAAPTGLSATAIDDQRIDLAWTDQSNDETGFRIERATGAGGSFAEIDLVGANVSSYQDAGLNGETEYCYRTRAYNTAGDSSYTAEMCATTEAVVVAPDPLGAPSGLTATADGDSIIQVDWTDNASDEVGFDVHRSSNGINGSYSRLAIVVQVNATGYTDNTVLSGNEYCYQVRAGRGPTDLGDFSGASCATAGTPPPNDPPSDPIALSSNTVNEQRIDLSWTDTADNESGFELERALGMAGSFVQIDLLGSNVSSYLDTGLDASTEYCYRVRAYNDVGNSNYTGTSCSITADAPPPGNCTDTGNHDSLSNLWGISQIKSDLNATWQATQTAGCELTPWFFGIDTGVDSNHPDLNVQEIMAFIALDPSHSGEDDHGHGTHTAGTAAAMDGDGGVVGVAPGAQVYGFKVCDSAGSCAIDDIVAGVDEVTGRKLANPTQPMVANMSLGGGGSVANDTAVRRSVNAGVVYAVSAGNGSLNGCIFPADSQNNSPARTGDDQINVLDGSDGNTARINGVITVTSSNSLDNDANCNYGNPVTVAAPGVDIYSTHLAGGYATQSGTSMASPHAAGAAILYLHRNPVATPVEVEQAIVNELDPWMTDDLPNADGRLDAETL